LFLPLIDDFGFYGFAAVFAITFRSRAGSRRRFGFLRRFFIDDFGQFVRSAHQRLARLLHHIGIGSLQGFFGFAQGAVDSQALIAGDFVAMFFKRFFRGVNQTIQLVFGFHLFAGALVLFGKLLGLLDVLFHVIFG